MLSLRQIEAVRAVFLSGTVMGAAKMLNVTPPSVSRMLRHAESVAGMTFFDRTANGFVATPEIVELLDDLEAIHDGILRINRRLDAAKRPTEGRLAVGISPGLGVWLAPRAIAAMHGTWPGVEISLDVLHREEFASRLVLQAVDLAMSIFEIDDPRIETVKLAEGRLVCLVPADHPFAQRSSLSIGELATETVIGFGEKQFQQIMIDDLLRKTGAILRPKLRVRLTVSAYFMVANGVGIALLDSFTVGASPSAGVAVIPLREHVPFTLNLFHNRAAPLSQISEAFCQTVRGALEETGSL